ncbi:MAG: hypothetical protein K2X87_31290 [Gemmataceae bacterium]|nr:hypothetical protein [Gemmataceae bacterium]
MVLWLWVGVALLVIPPIVVGLGLAVTYLYARWRYPGSPARIFQGKPPAG